MRKETDWKMLMKARIRAAVETQDHLLQLVVKYRRF
jgi:hypothetical protein